MSPKLVTQRTYVENKVNFTLEHAMKAQKVSKGKAILFL
jgi:hypothetical protein